MKRKIFSILFTLVLVLSLSLVTAVPVGANTDRLVPSQYGTIQTAISSPPVASAVPAPSAAPARSSIRGAGACLLPRVPAGMGLLRQG